MSVPSAILALDEHRLANDFTWQRLAEDMEAHGYPISPRTLHHVLKHRTGLRDRTLYKIQKFVEAVGASNGRVRRPA